MKAKSYTFINSDDHNKSLSNIPEEYYIDNTDLFIDNYDDSSRSYYFSRSIYGFLIKKEVLDNECKSLYTVDPISKDSRRIVFVKINKEISPAVRGASEIIRYSSADKWSVCFVREADDNYKIRDGYYLLSVCDVPHVNTRNRCFETEEDAIAEYNKRQQKNAARRKAKWDAIDNAPNNGDIYLATPKYIVKRIHIKTNYLSDVKEGDIVYGRITVLEKGKNKLNKSSCYANYIDLYVNDTFSKTLPMNVFGNLMSQNMELTIFV